MTNNLLSLKFERRPAPIIPEHRPLYKICQLLLILHFASRAGKSSLPRLQLFNWAFKNKLRQNKLIQAKHDRVLRVSAWGFDPAVAIAINYALAEGLISRTSTGYAHTATGADFIAAICKDDSNFESERRFLFELGKDISEEMVTKVSKGWGDL